MNEKYTILDNNSFRTLGRVQELDNTIWLVHSGTGIEFSFVGTGTTITMKADSMLTEGRDIQPRIAICVNGQRVVDALVDRPEKAFTVCESEVVQAYRVKVVKLSEAAKSTVGISKIEVDSMGDIIPTRESSRLIEFVGDSITCGYGVDDEEIEHEFSTSTEDVTKAYAYKTAVALDADYSMVSFSGYGIISGYAGEGKKVPEQTLPQYYDKLGFSHGIYMDGYLPQNDLWDFTRRQPDVVVINLGTNDSSYTQDIPERQEDFLVHYVDFLKKVRELNPCATILCTLGIMGTMLCPSVERAVVRYQEETGDANIHYMAFTEQRPEDGYAVKWHPTERTHTKAADKLTTELRKIMGW